MIKGTDLSHWDSVVKYDQMIDAGIRFGCLKLGQGQIGKDNMFEIHRTNFEQRNLPWDWYWFSDYRISGIDNAKQAVITAGGKFGRRHPVLDLEFLKDWGYPDGAHLRRFTLDYFDEFEKETTLISGFYSNRDVINQIMAGISDIDKARFLRHYLWLATDAPYGNPAPWSKYELNQYELDIPATWSNSAVDLDEFNGTEEEFAVWNNIPIPPPGPLDKTAILWREAGLHNWNLNG